MKKKVQSFAAQSTASQTAGHKWQIHLRCRWSFSKRAHYKMFVSVTSIISSDMIVFMKTTKAGWCQSEVDL